MRSLQQHRPLASLLKLFLPPLLVPERIRKEQARKSLGAYLAVQSKY